MIKVFNFTKFAKMAKMSQVAAMAKTIKRVFNGRKSQDSHIEQNDLKDQDSQNGPRWSGLAKRVTMAKLTEFDSIAKKSKKRIEKKQNWLIEPELVDWPAWQKSQKGEIDQNGEK